jgi:hypothetical protein
VGGAAANLLETQLESAAISRRYRQSAVHSVWSSSGMKCRMAVRDAHVAAKARPCDSAVTVSESMTVRVVNELLLSSDECRSDDP